MTTGQFPRRRETDASAALRAERIKAREAALAEETELAAPPRRNRRPWMRSMRKRAGVHRLQAETLAPSVKTRKRRAA